MRVLLVGNRWTQAPGGAKTVLVLTADLRAAGHEVVPFAVAEVRAGHDPGGHVAASPEVYRRVTS